MTEYWVSQGNKWCDFCKIFIANNPTSIRTHEFGQRHKDNVAKRLADIRKQNASKEKEKQQALKDMDRIEAQARRSYQKDLAANERAAPKASDGSNGGEWLHDESTGYLYNAVAGCYHDPKTGLYFSDKLGKWTSQQEALKGSMANEYVPGKSLGRTTSATASSMRPPGPGPVPSKLSMPVKGKASSLQVGKRKRPEKSQAMSEEEAAALKAREAAKKRVQEREKGFLGLYQS